jgi:Cu+-exporting ATPase
MVTFLRKVLGRGGTAIDPVCGMTVDKGNPPGGTFKYEGTTYYFCGRGCRLDFEEDPVGYLSGEKKGEM